MAAHLGRGQPFKVKILGPKRPTFLSGTGLTADASITESDDTLSSAAALAIAAAASITEADDSSTVAGALLILGDQAVTEANDTLGSAASIAIAADASITEADDTVTVAGALLILGAFDDLVAGDAQGEEDDALAATASLLITASLGATEENDSVASTGAFSGLESAVTEADDTLSATASLAIAAAVAITEADDTLATDVQVGEGVAVQPSVGGGPASRKRRPASVRASDSGHTLIYEATLRLMEDADSILVIGSARLSDQQVVQQRKLELLRRT